MAGFVAITEQEMDSFMTDKGFRPVSLEGVREKVYGKVVAPDVCLRVYSSIVAGEARDVGKDAIRAVLASRQATGIKVIGGSRRVNRTKNWRDNLTKRIEAWMEMMGPACPKCGGATVERNGAYGDFWGCCNYPNCKGIARA